MKKCISGIALFVLLFLFTGCAIMSDGKEQKNDIVAETRKPEETTKPEPTAKPIETKEPNVTMDIPLIEGAHYAADKFSLTVPKGWEIMDVEGGYQLYKMSGEIIEVHTRGSNQSEDHAKQQVERTASQYNGTPPAEVDFLGAKFWTTTFTASGVEQVTYLRIEDGVLFSVKFGGPDYATNPEFQAILSNIVFD